MKKLFSLILAGMIGGLITLGGVYLLTEQSSFPVRQDSGYTATPVKQINVPSGTNHTDNAPFDFRMAAAEAMPVVVHISASSKGSTAGNESEDTNPLRRFFGDDLPFFGNPFEGPRRGTGSGVVYTSDGYIITNNHVVESADEVEVTLSDNRKFQAKVIGTDKKTDLAVIRIEASGLPTMKLADSDLAEVGQWVLAVGNPFDLTSTVTAGIISAKGRNIQLLGGGDAIEAFIQTDAAVNPGNSGGALVDDQGRLLGINTAIASRTGTFAGYSFAIPINLVKRIVDDIIQYGSFQRAFLGVNITELDSEYAGELGVDISQGVVVEQLVDGGSAQYAGLQPKDIIVKVDNRDIKTVPELQEVIGRAKVGDTVVVTVNRKGKTKEIPVRLRSNDKF